MIIPHPDNLAFYDFAAVESEAFPFKFGWALYRPESRTVLSSSCLIEPSIQWNIEKTWTKAARTAHGIAFAQLKRHGMKPQAICRNLNRRLADREAFACNSSGDRWMRLLFDLSNIEPDFTMREISAELLTTNLADERGFTDAELGSYKTKALEVAPPNRQGEPTARHYTTLFALLWRAHR
jgi:hypothetical protein